MIIILKDVVQQKGSGDHAYLADRLRRFQGAGQQEGPNKVEAEREDMQAQLFGSLSQNHAGVHEPEADPRDPHAPDSHHHREEASGEVHERA